MIDFYLRAPDRAAMDIALTAAGLLVGDAPAPGVCIDRIGPYAIVMGYDGETPILEQHPNYHANVRVLFDFHQASALAGLTITPPETPYRIWMTEG